MPRRWPGLDRLLAVALPATRSPSPAWTGSAGSLRDLLKLVDDLEDRGLGVYAVGQGIDTRTDTGRTMVMLFGSLAENERAWLIERPRAGLDTARAAAPCGEAVGGP